MKTLGAILTLVLVIALGIFIFNKADDDIARDNNAATDENLSGIGGPDVNYDALNTSGSDIEDNSDESGVDYEDKG